MKFFRALWTPPVRPTVAAALLLFPFAACAPNEPQAAPEKASMSASETKPTKPAEPIAKPAPPAPKPEALPLPEPKPEPKPEAQPTPAPEPVAKPVPAPEPPKDPEPVKDPTPKPAPKPADVSVTGFEVGSAVGPDGHVTEPKTVFAASDSVRLAVLADGAPRTIRLSVEWYGPDGARISEDVQDVTLSGAQAVPFTLSNAKGLALGAYRGEIRIEGWLASTADFEVR